MKKLVMMLMTMILLVSLCGCNAATTNNGPEPGTALSTFYQAIIDAQPADAEALILFEENNPKIKYFLDRPEKYPVINN